MLPHLGPKASATEYLPSDLSPPRLVDSSPAPTTQDHPSLENYSNLKNCPSLDQRPAPCSNSEFAYKLLDIEKESPSFEKASKALELLALQGPYTKLTVSKLHLPSFQNGQAILTGYLINTILIPLCLEGFIHVEELLQYRPYLPYVCQSFLEPDLRLIDPSFEDLVHHSLAQALKQQDTPCKDYTYEDVQALVFSCTTRPHSLGALRFIDMHCGHLGYRPVLSVLVKGLLGAIRYTNLEEVSKTLNETYTTKKSNQTEEDVAAEESHQTEESSEEEGISEAEESNNIEESNNMEESSEEEEISGAEEGSETLEADISPKVSYFIFFSYNLSQSLQLYGAPSGQGKNGLYTHAYSRKQDLKEAIEDLETSMIEALGQLYRVNLYILHMLKAHNQTLSSDTSPSLCPSVYDGTLEQILYGLNTQAQFAYLYPEEPFNSESILNAHMIANSAQTGISYLQAHFH